MSFQIIKVKNDKSSFFRALASVMDFSAQDEDNYPGIRNLLIELLKRAINGRLESIHKPAYLNYLISIITNNLMMPSYLIAIVGATLGFSICVIQPLDDELVLTRGDNDPLTRAKVNNLRTKKDRKDFPCDVFIYYNGGDEHSGG